MWNLLIVGVLKVYTGQGQQVGVGGEGGINADDGEPRTPDDKIYLWHALARVRLTRDGERRRGRQYLVLTLLVTTPMFLALIYT